MPDDLNRRAFLVATAAVAAGTFTSAAAAAPPPKTPGVVTGPATAITETTLTLNGTVNPRKRLTTAWFEWGTTTAYGNSTPNVSVGSGNAPVSISATLTGLAPDTEYHFRAGATSSAGTTFGADMITRTRLLTSDPRTLVFEETFASGAFTAWQSCQWNAGGSIRNDNCQTYDGTSDYSATVANGGAGHEQAARFELRNGDIPFSGTERCEIAEAPGTEVGPGDERWIEWDMKFDASMPVPIGNWFIPQQWHGNAAGTSPPLCLDIDTDDVIYLANNDATGFQRTAIQAVQRNVWQHWEIHAKFSDSLAVGFAEVKIDDVVVLAQHARKTMITADSGNYFKTGIYRDPVNVTTAILWHDNIRMWAP